MRLILRFIGFAFTAGAILFLIGAGVVGYVFHRYSRDLPDYTQLADYEPMVTTRVHAGDGAILAEYSRERRLFLPMQAIPPLVVAAFLSAEDKNFYKHGGVDPEGVARAAVNNLRSGGRRQQGASTITQQVAKNFLLTNEQTYERKIKELILSLRMESVYSKDRILELYLNEIYLGTAGGGPGNYGVAAAALNYFGKSVNELTLPEAAYLAALPKAPTNYHPFRQREAAIERRNWVIDRMVENGYVSRADGDKAKASPLDVSPRSLPESSAVAGFFTEEVRRELAERYGEKELYEGGLSVRTTLDPTMQVMARKALVDGLVRYDESHGWRGAQQRIDLANGEWGEALAQIKSFGDVKPWQLAVVLSVDAQKATIGLQPRREASGAVNSERRTGAIGLDGIRWTRKGRVNAALQPGDVIYAEPVDSRSGQFRLRQIPEISGALVAMDPNTGRVFAMVGGFSFDQSEFNRATQAWRQPGSSFKPFVYATALDNGYTPSSIVVDGAFELDQGPGLGMWRPENYNRKFAGPRTLRYGIEQSKNLMTVRLAHDVGMPLVSEYAKRFGVYDDMPQLLSMALGAGETTVLRMTTAYSMFVNGGRRIKPTLIDRIQDRWGKTVYRHDERQCVSCNAEAWSDQREPTLVDKREQVLDPLTAYQIVSILEGAVQRGTGTVVKSVGKPLAGKTGTSNDAKDVWFVGFSPDLAVGVFLGYDKPRSLGGRVSAGVLAAPIFRDFMTMALKDKPATPFRVPPGIKLIQVDAHSGQRSSGGSKGTILEAFKPGTAPPDGYAMAANGGETTGAVHGDSAGRGGGVGAGTGGLY